MCFPPANRASSDTANPAPLLNPQPGAVLNSRFLVGPTPAFQPSDLAAATAGMINNRNVCRGDLAEPDSDMLVYISFLMSFGSRDFVSSGLSGALSSYGWVRTLLDVTEDGATALATLWNHNNPEETTPAVPSGHTALFVEGLFDGVVFFDGWLVYRTE